MVARPSPREPRLVRGGEAGRPPLGSRSPEAPLGVPVGENLRVPGHSEVFVLGDASLSQQEGKPLPPLGQVAFQTAPTPEGTSPG